MRVRLIALFVAIFGSTLILFSFLVYNVFISNHEQEFDSALYNYAIDVSQAVEVDLFGGISLSPNILGDSEKVFPFALGETYLELRSIDGRSIARSRSLGRANLPLTQAEAEQLLKGKKYDLKTVPAKEIRSTKANSRKYRILSMFIDKPGPGDFVLQVAVPMLLIESEKRALFTFFATAIPFVLVVAAFGGLYVSRKALSPFNAIIAKSQLISARQLSERVPVPRANDEIRHLALTLNGLLDRLEGAFRAQETFTADASHQLKTPLAILMGEIELMRSRARSPEELSEFLASAQQEVSHLSKMVEDLLMLARMDSGSSSLAIQSTRFDEVVLEALPRLERIASAKNVKVQMDMENTDDSASFDLRGDPGLLRCVVENLVENAIKYSKSGGKVSLKLHAPGGDVVLFKVKDDGKGIAEEDKAKLFNRFYRGETTRDSIPGSGLGLAIAKRIAEVHGGKISVESSPGAGAEFTLELPT